MPPLRAGHPTITTASADVLGNPVHTAGRKVMLSWGIGKHSTAILLRWLEDPSSRDFDLDQLVVVHAVTGEEWPDSLRLAEQHILPRLAAKRVRLVQLARGGFHQADGVTVLNDTRQPTRMFRSGPVRLSAELLLAGTVPMVAAGKRTCTHKWKSWPLDTWSAAELGGDYIHVLGFHAGEAHRALRDHSYTTNARIPAYPLLTWNWDDADTRRYLLEQTGQAYPSSYCTFCPFLLCVGTRTGHLQRLRQHPDLAAEALLIEHVSVALNPKATLYGSSSLFQHITDDGNSAALERYGQLLRETPWAIYEIRRDLRAANNIPRRRGSSARSVRTLRTGTHEQMRGLLHAVAADHGMTIEDHDGHPRLWLRRRRTELAGTHRIREYPLYPSVEHVLVAAPAVVLDKQGTRFESRWREVLALLSEYHSKM